MSEDVSINWLEFRVQLARSNILQKVTLHKNLHLIFSLIEVMLVIDEWSTGWEVVSTQCPFWKILIDQFRLRNV